MRRFAPALALLTALALAPPARAAAPAPVRPPAAAPAPAPAAGGCCYDLTPFADTDPALVTAWQADRAAKGGPDPTTALAALATWRADHQGATDVVADRAARWLTARLQLRVGAAAAATATLRELVALPYGAFTDAARGALADRLARAKDPVGAAELRLARLPATPGFAKDALSALTALERAGHTARAAELLDATLERSVDGDHRVALTERLAQLRWQLGAKDAARRLAADLWWRARSDADRASAERLLKTFKAPIDANDRLAREVVTAGRPDRKDRRKLRRARISGRLKRTVRAWAEALYDRFDDPAAASKRLARFAKYAKKTTFEPWFRFGEAELLRKLDQDSAAVDAYLDVADRWPDHPLVGEALERASGLLRYLERAVEANAADQRLVARGGHDEVHRAALWRVGFDAWLAHNPSGAETFLARLSDRYGGEPDIWAMMWAERADYWRARAAEVSGDRARAHVLYTNVALRFPTSWYALLSRDRLGSAAPPPETALDADRGVPRTPWLDTAVALVRLGDDDGAIAALEALFAADYLPGAGRALLADLLTRRGDAARATKVLKKSLVPAVPVDDVTAESFKAWFPFDFADAIATASAEHDIAPALLAGIASVETGFHANAQSGPGAIGLCQLMPRTGTALGRRLFGPRFRTHQLYDPETNLRVAAYLLSLLRDRWGDQPAVLAAAYNAGNGPVARWIAAHGDLETDAFVELIPFAQARRYVKRVMSAAEIYRRLYGLGDAPLPLPRTVRMPRPGAPDDDEVTP